MQYCLFAFKSDSGNSRFDEYYLGDYINLVNLTEEALIAEVVAIYKKNKNLYVTT